MACLQTRFDCQKVEIKGRRSILSFLRFFTELHLLERIVAEASVGSKRGVDERLGQIVGFISIFKS